MESAARCSPCPAWSDAGESSASSSSACRRTSTRDSSARRRSSMRPTSRSSVPPALARMTPSDFAFLPAWPPSSRGVRVTCHARGLASWLSSIVPAAASSAGDPVTRTEPAPTSLSGLATRGSGRPRVTRGLSLGSVPPRRGPGEAADSATSPSAMPHMGARKPPSAGVTRVGHSVRCGNERSAETTRKEQSVAVSADRSRHAKGIAPPSAAGCSSTRVPTA